MKNGGFWRYGEVGVVNGTYVRGQDLEAGPGAVYYAYCANYPMLNG